MKTIQEIKDEVARELCYANYPTIAEDIQNGVADEDVLDKFVNLYAEKFQQSKEIELPSDDEIENWYAVSESGSFPNFNKTQYDRRDGVKWMRKEIRKLLNKK